MNNLTQHILITILRVYRAGVSPVLAALTVPMGMGCRFTPTCSQYAIEAIQRYGALRGGALAGRRLCRCHPWGGCGHDPVPASESESGFPPDGTGSASLKSPAPIPRFTSQRRASGRHDAGPATGEDRPRQASAVR